MSRHALVVDDNHLLVRTLSDILRLAGWDVTPASSGSEAVERVAAGEFDVVLMDIRMPGVSGVDAFRAMRALRPEVRVILMSAYTAPELIAAAEQEGALRVLSKPVDPRMLLTLLEPEPGSDSPRPVLIVDSDRAFLRTLSDLLTSEGHETVLAHDLDHATELLSERRPIAVLLHLHLGTVSAREAVTTVHRAGPDTALIIYSGRPGAGREIAELVPAEWLHAFLQKPFETANVSAVLRGLHD